MRLIMLTQPHTWAKYRVQTALKEVFRFLYWPQVLNAAHSVLIYVGTEECVIYRGHVCNHIGSRVINECHMF